MKMNYSSLSFAAFIMNAAFSVAQTASEGSPVAHEQAKFAVVEKQGGEDVAGGSGAATIDENSASVQENSFVHFNVQMEDGSSSNVQMGDVVPVEMTYNKKVEMEKEEKLRKEISDLSAQNLELKLLLVSVRQLSDQNIGEDYDRKEDIFDANRKLSKKSKINKNAKSKQEKMKKSKSNSESEEDESSSEIEEDSCDEIAFKPTVEVVTHATNVNPRDDLFWSTWKEGAETALNDTAYLKWNAVGYDSAAAVEALEKACSSSDAIVVTVPYASGTEDYKVMDDAINKCMFDHQKPVFTANTDTYHNDDVYAFFGSSNYDMGVKCALAILFPDNVDIISGREALPDTTDHSKYTQVFWDAASKKDEGLRQRFEGLETTFKSFDKELVKYLPTGRPSCPCVQKYPDGVPTDDDVGLSMTIEVNGENEVYQYPPKYGLETCSRHDKNMIPSCSLADPPSFCDKTWCYVDPDNCEYVEPSTEGEYEWTDYPDQKYPYSYETCGSKNLYTDFIGEDNDEDEDEADGGTSLTGENITTIVLSSNWAPDFEIDDQTDNLFICGEETYSMPHVAQFGQSPFLQGLSSAAAAAAAAKSIEKKTEWRAFMGNSAASSSSNSYQGSGNSGDFGICLRDESTSENVRRANVQCWDNDNNGLGQEIGNPGRTRDSDGCYTVHYDADRSWDWAYGNAQRPDIYCIVTYNGGNWRMPERTNADGSFFIYTFVEIIPPPREVKICVQSSNFNFEAVSGAHVQCWDNDNNGAGQPVGDKGMTGDDGCYTAYYDRESVGDGLQLFGRDPDVYCDVNYLGQQGRTNENEGVNLNNEIFQFSPVQMVTTFRSKIKEDLSEHGKAIVRMFERYNVQVGDTWDVFGDAMFDDNWIFMHPPQEYIGISSRYLPVPETCEEGDNCNTEFALKKCGEGFGPCEAKKICPGPGWDGEELYSCEENVKGVFFAAGKCEEVEATRTSASSEAEELCVGHSDSIYDRMFNLIIQAEEHIDITSLGSPNEMGVNPFPDYEQFGSMFRNAIQYLDSTNRSVTIKFLFGSTPNAGGGNFLPILFLNKLLDGPTGTPPNEKIMLTGNLKIYAGTYRTAVESWNHGKIIAVDGKKVFTGGTNYCPLDYLQEDPVFDVNIMVSNGPAIAAHKYAAKMWTPICEWDWEGLGLDHVEVAWILDNNPPNWASGLGGLSDPEECPPVFNGINTPNSYAGKTRGGAMVIQAARLGKLAEDEGQNSIEDGKMTSDLAMVAMMESAQTSIKFSQQDMLPVILDGAFASNFVTTWTGYGCGSPGCSGMTKISFEDTWRIIGSIAKALSREVRISIMVSAPCALGAGLGESEPTSTQFACPRNGEQGPGFDYWSDVYNYHGETWPSPLSSDGMHAHITESMSPLGAISVRRRLSYGYGWNLHNINDWIFAYYAINRQYRPLIDGRTMNRNEVVDHICSFVDIGHVRLTANEPTYMRANETGSEHGGQIGNHAKIVMVDDEAFYIGSDNAYGGGLAEFGLIIDDAAKTEDFKTNYWDVLWNEAKGTTEFPGLVSGGGTNDCPWKTDFNLNKNWQFN